MNGQKPVEKENRGRTGGDGDDDDGEEREREIGDTLVRGVGLSFSLVPPVEEGKRLEKQLERQRIIHRQTTVLFVRAFD